MTEHARLSSRIAAIAESATLKVDAKAKALQAEGRPVISYAAGEPDFATPDSIVEAALVATRDPKNYRYTPAAGLPELREAIAAKTLRDSGLEVGAGQVVVTNGGKQAVYQAFQVLLDDGDEVLVPTPYWTTYPEAIKLAGGRQVDVFAGADQGYLLQGTTSDAVVRFRDVPDPQAQVPSYWNGRGDRVFVPSGGSSGVVGMVLGLDGSEVVVPRGPGSFPYGWMGDELVALVPRPAGSGTAFALESWRAGGDWAPTGTVITVPEYAASRGLHQFTASLSPDATRLAIAVQTATSGSVVEVRSYDLPSGAPVPWREVDPTTARVSTGDVSVPSREDSCPMVWRAGLPLTQLFGSAPDETQEGLELRRWMPSGSSRPITVTEDRVGGRCMLWATSALEGSPTWSVSGTSTSWLTWWWRELLAAAVLVVVVGWGLRARARRRAVSAILGG